MNLKIKIKIIIICLSLVSHFVVHAQETKKKPSWTEKMPERKNAPGMQIQIDKDNDFGMDRGSFDFDGNELSDDEDDASTQDSSDNQLTNKIEIQKKLDEERKKNAAQSAKIEKLEAEKIELQRLAKQNQKEEQEKIEAQELATQNQAEQERVEAQKPATQNQEEQEKVEAQRLATKIQQEQEEIEARRLAAQIQQEQEEIEARRLAAQTQAVQEEAQALEALEVKKELSGKVEYNWKKIKNVVAVYPTKAARTRKEGWVEVAIIIDTNGSVIDSRVVKSSNDMRIFDKSALRAVRQWKYDPPANYGIKEQLNIVIRMTYKL